MHCCLSRAPSMEDKHVLVAVFRLALDKTIEGFQFHTFKGDLRALPE